MLSWETVPCGGIVALDLQSAALPASWVLTRYVSGVAGLSTGTVLVSGATDAIPFYIDIGDGTNAPLNPQTLYVYGFSTSAGTVYSDTITVSGAIVLEPDSMTRVLGRCLEAGLVSLVLPLQFKAKPTFSYAMPITTQLRFPMVIMNLDLMQQEEIPIGQGIDTDSTRNFYNVPANVMRRYVVRVFATTVDEREFLRDAVIAIFSTLLMPLLSRLGQNVSHSFQASNGQMVADQMQPGVFFAEISLQFSGLYNIGVSTYYGPIDFIALPSV
jgi:hypothetical protein